MGRKHRGKRRNCLLPAISPFSTVFSNGLFPRGVKRCHCVGRGISWMKMAVLQMGRKHYGKRRNCSLQAISSFHTVFSIDLFCRHVKTRACLGKGYPVLRIYSFQATSCFPTRPLSKQRTVVREE